MTTDPGFHINSHDAVLSWFSGRRVVVATRHRKESVIAPLLMEGLGMQAFVLEDFDTDRFGTFSGEIERLHDPVTTLKMKCSSAMDISGSDLAVANEGSFGPHPTLWMLPADEEWIMISDRRNNLEVMERELTTETNFSSAIVGNKEELEKFAAKVLFPSHALILRQTSGTNGKLLKGINGFSQLMEAYGQLADKEGRVHVETDMRALYNPTRMKVIQKLTGKLIARLHNLCPVCSSPGFGITGTIPGRPCSQCETPTSSVLAHQHSCNRCGHSINIPVQENQREDPMYCDVCNP